MEIWIIGIIPDFDLEIECGETLHQAACIRATPIDLFAATTTPLVSTFLGMELFGAVNGLHLATACIVAYTCSGQRGIYAAQRLPADPHPPGRE